MFHNFLFMKKSVICVFRYKFVSKSIFITHCNLIGILSMDHYQSREIFSETETKSETVYVCKCLCPESSSENLNVSEYKKRILSAVARTESYLRERRIPELIRFLLSKVLGQESDKPVLYLEKLLDDCMLFRAGVGAPPVLFENRHLKAVIKSFDPGQRGWLTTGQIRRLYATLGLPATEVLQESVSCDEVLKNVVEVQENELFELVSAGMNKIFSDV